MTRGFKPKTRRFSAFRSAAEEAQMKESGHQGEHMSCTSGRIVQVIDAHNRFRVILSRTGGGTIESEFATMREAEAFMRRNTPRVDDRSTLHDRDAKPS